jgi:hypothetical protein
LAKAAAEGVAPLEVMLENMRYYQQLAKDAEAVIAGMTAAEISGDALTPDEQFKFLLAKAKHAAGVRHLAHECARDAAPYMHARLPSTTFLSPSGDTFIQVLAIINQKAKGDQPEVTVIEHQEPEGE